MLEENVRYEGTINAGAVMGLFPPGRRALVGQETIQERQVGSLQ